MSDPGSHSSRVTSNRKNGSDPQWERGDVWVQNGESHDLGSNDWGPCLSLEGLCREGPVEERTPRFWSGRDRDRGRVEGPVSGVTVGTKVRGSCPGGPM